MLRSKLLSRSSKPQTTLSIQRQTLSTISINQHHVRPHQRGRGSSSFNEVDREIGSDAAIPKRQASYCSRGAVLRSMTLLHIVHLRYFVLRKDVGAVIRDHGPGSSSRIRLLKVPSKLIAILTHSHCLFSIQIQCH